MGVDNAIEGNSRLSRCIALVSKPPANAIKLVLHVVSDPPLQLGEWSREELNTSLAHEIDSMMSEHHDDAGVADSKFSASYVADDGRVVKVKTFAIRTRRGITANDAEGLASAMDGSLQATNTLVQQTALAMVRMYLTAQQAQMQSQLQWAQLMVQQATASERRAEEARELSHQIREAYAELQSREEALTPAQEKFYEVLSLAVPGMIQKFSA